MRKLPKATKRPESFATKPSTRIWYEKPTTHNPYIANECRCFGYELNELADHCSYSEMLFLLLTGRIPSQSEDALLNALLVGFANPGPRHPATRAAMYAGVSKTDSSHILPISLSIAGGNHLGGKEVEASMRFLKKHSKDNPTEVAKKLVNAVDKPGEGDLHITPGFGSRFGDIDLPPKKIASLLISKCDNRGMLHWGDVFAAELNKFDMGWLMTGVAAAAFADLGFQPRAAAGLFQISCAPGMLAHGLEMANKPVTAMPFLDDSDYVIEND